MDAVLYLTPLVGLLALGFPAFKSQRISAANPGNKRIIEISEAIREGAMSF